jgi:hypothetical protein
MLCLWFIHLELPGYISHLALLSGTSDRVTIRKDLFILLLGLHLYKHTKMKLDVRNIYRSARSCHIRHLHLGIRISIRMHVHLQSPKYLQCGGSNFLGY